MTDVSATSAPPATPAAGLQASRYQVITRQRHGAWHWQRPPHYGAAATVALAPLASFEIAVAALRLPLAFVQQAGRFVLVAVLGLPPARNLCVAPNGQWTGPYIPAVFRTAPFGLSRTPDGQQLLSIDEQAARAAPADAASSGEPFFAPDGSPAPLVAKVLEFSMQLDEGTRSMEKACAALHAQGLLVPWHIAFDAADGTPAQPAQGLWRVDEAALRTLGADALHALMQQGAVTLAYGQMFSMHNIGLLGEWARSQKPPSAAAVEPSIVQKLFDPAPSDTIQFNW